MMAVAELMTPAPIYALRTDAVGSIRQEMLDRGIHCLPVIDSKGHPVGIVSSWDLVEEHPASDLIETVMTSKVITVGAHEAAEEAAIAMQTNFIHHLVVVDEVDAVVGVVSSLDLLTALLEP